jgi:predicted PurR-regulated permease PerM
MDEDASDRAARDRRAPGKHGASAALLFVVVQSIEGYLLLPLIERNTVSLPPAVTITKQLLMGLAFGLPGVALATPFAATVAVAVRMLYVEDVLGEP